MTRVGTLLHCPGYPPVVPATGTLHHCMLDNILTVRAGAPAT